jgi:hypothetical protein
LAVYSKTAALLTRRLTTLAFNPAHVGDTCFNSKKVGYCLSDCLLSYAFCTKLKELEKLLKSKESEDNKLLTSKTGKDTF